MALTCKGGFCYACDKNFVPCRLALSGCFNHVHREPSSRKRKACSLHDSQVCMFNPKRVKLKCVSRYCANCRIGPSSPLCSECDQGFTPCPERCSRRIDSSKGPLCSICLLDVSDPAERASLLTSSYSATPLEHCASPGCDRFVDGDALCALCAAHCFPCSTQGCKRRATPETGGKCTSCLGIVFRPQRTRPSAAPNASCAFSIVGCPNLASKKTSGNVAVCDSCHLTGFPCVFASAGCVNTLSLRHAKQSATCISCLKKGQPCVGASGHGCGHPRIHCRKRYPRRCVVDNNSCCARCRPAKCSNDHCSSVVHDTYWALRLCYKHGKENALSATATPNASATVTAAAASCPTASSKTFAARFKQKLHMSSVLQCSFRGCDAAGRSTTLTDGSHMVMCSLHHSWFLPKAENSLNGHAGHSDRLLNLADKL